MTEFARVRISDAARVSDALQQAAVQQDVPAPAGPGYLHYWTFTLPKGHEHVRNVCGKQLGRAGFESTSTFASWEKFGVRGNVMALLTAVPLPGGHTYVQVLATAPEDAAASAAATDLRDRVRNDTSVPID